MCLKWLWKEPVVWLDHRRCSKWRPVAFICGRSRVCHWSMASSMMPSGIRSQVSMSLCFSLSVSRFGYFCFKDKGLIVYLLVVPGFKSWCAISIVDWIALVWGDFLWLLPLLWALCFHTMLRAYDTTKRQCRLEFRLVDALCCKIWLLWVLSPSMLV